MAGEKRHIEGCSLDTDHRGICLSWPTTGHAESPPAAAKPRESWKHWETWEAELAAKDAEIAALKAEIETLRSGK
jgi:hypothetical protein